MFRCGGKRPRPTVEGPLKGSSVNPFSVWWSHQSNLPPLSAPPEDSGRTCPQNSVCLLAWGHGQWPVFQSWVWPCVIRVLWSWIKIMVFSDVMVYSSRWIPAYPSNGGSRFLWNIGIDLPDFIISNSRSLQCYILCWHSCDFIFINNYIMTHLSKTAIKFSCCKHYLLTRHTSDINFNFKLTQNWMWLYYLNGNVFG